MILAFYVLFVTLFMASFIRCTDKLSWKMLLAASISSILWPISFSLVMLLACVLGRKVMDFRAEKMGGGN